MDQRGFLSYCRNFCASRCRVDHSRCATPGHRQLSQPPFSLVQAECETAIWIYVHNQHNFPIADRLSRSCFEPGTNCPGGAECNLSIR